MDNQVKPHKLEGEVKTFQKEVTPKWASDCLERMQASPTYKNRPLSEATVASYASDMKNGLWTPNPNPIVFDEEGILLDGQHRLWAIVFAEVTITLTITEGWSRKWTTKAGEVDIMDNIDRGRRRSIGQQLQLSHGISSGHKTASTLRQIACIYGLGQNKLSTAGHLLIHRYYGAHVEAIFGLATSAKQRVSYITGPLALLDAFDSLLATRFARNFFHMENLIQDSAELSLLRFLERNEQMRRGSESDRDYICKAVITCLMALSGGKKMGTKFIVQDKAQDWLIDKQPSEARNAINEFLLKLKKSKRAIEL